MLNELDHFNIGTIQKIRSANVLLEQIKTTHNELKDQFKELKGEEVDSYKIKSFQFDLSWLKESIRYFYKIRSRELEGVVSGVIREVENDVLFWEMSIKIIQSSVSFGNTITHHLR